MKYLAEARGKSGQLINFTFLKKRKWVTGILLAVIFVFMIFLALRLIPFAGLKTFLNRQNSTRFYDKNGTLLSIMPLKDGLYREYYPLKEIPESIQEIFIEAEDKNFYHHPGIDISSIIRAAYQNKTKGKIVSGASTITMQLVRLIHPRNPKAPITLSVKLKEAIEAVQLETKLSKSKILELYLNSIPFGFQAEGVGSAARIFFGKNLKNLNQEQIYALSIVPRRPQQYNPLKHPEASYSAAMDIGEKNNFSDTKQDWLTALKKTNTTALNCPCPHFINYIIQEYSNHSVRIPDTLELSIDATLNALISEEILQNLEKYKNARIENGAAFVINNHTGQIEAWVGNGDFYDSKSGQIDGVLVNNQAGSSMKPFLYALALESGFKPTTVLPDIPMDFGSEHIYVPFNFNNQYNGPQRLRVCLASSLNIPAVYTLYRIGLDSYYDKLISIGFDSLIGKRQNLGLSLALGSGEVSLYELVRAFSLFPRDGTLPQISWFKNLRDPESKIFKTKKKYAGYEPDTTRIICNMLSDKQARSLGFGFANVFDTEYPAIFKTGTSNQFQDIVALGATTGYTAGVWMGNFNGDTVIHKTGSSIPAGVVRAALDYLTNKYPDSAQKFKAPEGYIKQKICTLSGMKAGPYCPSTTYEYIRKDTPPEDNPVCDWHTKDSGRIHIIYPSEYQHWGGNKNYNGTFQTQQGKIRFLYPTDGAVFIYDHSLPENVQELCIEAIGSDSAELFVDEKSFGSKKGRLLWIIKLTKGEHTLKIQNENSQNRIKILVK